MRTEGYFSRQRGCTIRPRVFAEANRITIEFDLIPAGETSPVGVVGLPAGADLHTRANAEGLAERVGRHFALTGQVPDLQALFGAYLPIHPGPERLQ